MCRMHFDIFRKILKFGLKISMILINLSKYIWKMLALVNFKAYAHVWVLVFRSFLGLNVSIERFF